MYLPPVCTLGRNGKRRLAGMHMVGEISDFVSDSGFEELEML